MIEIINKKRLSLELSKEEIEFVIENYVNGNITDYQMSSLLRAICINGMNDNEIFYLTDAMIKSGETLDLTNIKNVNMCFSYLK